MRCGKNECLPSVKGGGDIVTSTVSPDCKLDKDVDGHQMDNRYFFRITLGNESYEALFVPGAMVSVISDRVAEPYKDRIESNNTVIRSATGGMTVATGTLDLNITVDGHSKKFNVKVLSKVTQDIILGVDFLKAWNMDEQLGPGL